MNPVTAESAERQAWPTPDRALRLRNRIDHMTMTEDQGTP